MKEWSDCIVDWTFTKEEILKQFYDNNIKIPESFLKNFDDLILIKKTKRNNKYYKQLKDEGKL